MFRRKKREKAWQVSYLHEDCTVCEACADVAIEMAEKHGDEFAVWHDLGPNEDIRHMAEVSKE